MKKVLIVDDEKQIRKILKLYLESKDFEVREAGDGKEALEVLENESIDVVFMDIQMPHLNGIEAVNEIKKRKLSTIIIALTAFTDQDIMKKAAKVGFDMFISRPIDFDEIDDKLKDILEYKDFYKEKHSFYTVYSEAFSEISSKLNFLKEEKDLLIMESINLVYHISEYRDDETHAHTMRIGILSSKLASNAKFDVKYISEIRLAAPLHDLGKVGIPDRILLKPGKLDNTEWEIMKQHAVIGFNMLRGTTSSIFKLASEIAISHHERWNGSGYPKGLKEEEIPISGQIVAITDSFDAMVSKRPYKEAFPYDFAFEEIEKNAGILYNPELVKVFLSMKDEIYSMYEHGIV
ncbi:HD domain-containing phosphohydrolase [Thermosipho atlanticus]|uniref:Putative two-component system response regulator n=1 Tax=Thermosipho atlanticus DSM 15807 TaxID=1123380 RepID=A0A1M5RZL4_9BACT|nr:HD domain-containing phosphohydrolase [Thermosipho atlanticus]SHH31614.1 putative two-component system response regulator [Thermosipho atlanticus DSM 15807]